MACSWCEPNGWKSRTCCLCGVSTVGGVFISISIATDDDESDYPYTTTDLCKRCWGKFGIEPALNHNVEIRQCAS